MQARSGEEEPPDTQVREQEAELRTGACPGSRVSVGRRSCRAAMSQPTTRLGQVYLRMCQGHVGSVCGHRGAPGRPVQDLLCRGSEPQRPQTTGSRQLSKEPAEI